MRRLQLALAVVSAEWRFARENALQAVCGGQASPLGRCGFYSPTKENVMKAMNLLAKLVRDEQGGEVLEYALIVGLIIVAAIAAITSVGTKVLARWTSLNASM
jgi:Flp pilus assembly pilin Flp